MIKDPYVTYQADSEQKKERLKKLYDKFIEEYALDITRGKLIVKERFDKNGIEISPEKGKIHTIRSLKPYSELETKLIKISWKYKNSSFRTKYNEIIDIEANYKKQ